MKDNDYFLKFAINLHVLLETKFAFYSGYSTKIISNQRPDPPSGGTLDEDQVDLGPPPPKEGLRSSFRHLSLLGWDV
jgi:hypothetical protein